MKKGFTLAELLISLGIVAVLVAIAIMTTKDSTHRDALLVKKGYNTISSTVHEMVQTEAYYKSGSFNDPSATTKPINGEYPSGSTKFCKVFVSFLNTVDENIDCTANTLIPSFTTPNGIDWYMPPKAGTDGNFTTSIVAKLFDNTEFAGTIDGLLIAGKPDRRWQSTDDPGGEPIPVPVEPEKSIEKINTDMVPANSNTTQSSQPDEPTPDEPTPDVPADPSLNMENYRENIMIDVNGSKKPNCIVGSENCKNPDRFIIQVSATGKLYLPNELTREYIKNSGSVIKK